MPEISLPAALLQGKCPRCRKGKIFKYPISRITRFHVMNDTCPHCEVSFNPEPGFYQGAMYVGYAFTILAAILISVALYFLGDPSEWIYGISLVGFMILVAPFNYRHSRILYLHFFGRIRYDARYGEEVIS